MKIFLLATALLGLLQVSSGSREPSLRQGDDNCTCGQRGGLSSNDNKIVNGVQAEPNEVPWRVALYMVSLTNIFSGRYSFFCGASILNEEWIVTAAHCADAARLSSLFYPIKVVAGVHDLRNKSQVTSNEYIVARTIIHPNYNRRTYDNDIALMRLRKKLNISDKVSPGCLPYNQVNNDFVDVEVLASGWGVTNQSGNDHGRELTKVDLDTISNEECQKMYEENDIKITDGMICTYNHDNSTGEGKDTCQGDSGGSIDWKNEENGLYFLTGVVSFGDGCAKEGKPGVYARVTKFLKFITETTKTNFCRK